MIAPAPPQPPVPGSEPQKRAGASRTAIWIAAAALLLAVVVIAVIVWPEGSPTAGPVARTDAEAPLVTDPAHVPLPLSEDPRDFLAGFTTAVQNGDVDWLLGRLNPAVTQRYGAEQCRAYLRSSVIDPTMRLQLSTVTGPGSWEWSTDERSTVVDEVYRGRASLPPRQRDHGQPVARQRRRQAHVVRRLRHTPTRLTSRPRIALSAPSAPPRLPNRPSHPSSRHGWTGCAPNAASPPTRSRRISVT